MCVYFVLMLIGGGFLIGSFLIGEAFDFAEGAGEGVVHAVDSMLEAVHIDLFPDHFDVASDHGDQSVNPFSVRGIAGFCAFFGAVGTILSFYNAPFLVVFLVSLGSGLVGWIAVWLITLLFVRQGGTTQVGDADFLEQVGRITVPIPKDGSGTVTVVVGGQSYNMAARCEEGAVENGARVLVVEKRGATLFVRRFTES